MLEQFCKQLKRLKKLNLAKQCKYVLIKIFYFIIKKLPQSKSR